jgi:hypothetical protein
VLGRHEGALSAGSAYIVRFMVVNALGPALLALLAVVLQLLAVPEPALWRLCSGLYLGSAVFVGALSFREERSLARAGELFFAPSLSRSIWTGAFLAHLVQLSNLIGFPLEPSIGVFLLGLWMLLLLAGIQFVALLFLALR